MLDSVQVRTMALSVLLSDDWLSQDVLNLFLAVLQYDLRENIRHNHNNIPDATVDVAPNRNGRPPGHLQHILSVEGTTKIMMLYSDRDYIDTSSTHYLHVLGKDLAAGEVKSCAGIFHITNNHWVSVVVDVTTCRILHTDSLDVETDPRSSRVVKAMAWWLEQHGLSGFSVENMNVTPQLNGFSCGVLSFASIAHHFLSTQYPLPSPGPSHAGLARMALFHRIVALSTHTSDRYPDVWTFACKGIAADWLTIPKMFASSRKCLLNNIHISSASVSSGSDSDASSMSVFMTVLQPKKKQVNQSRKSKKSHRSKTQTQPAPSAGLKDKPEVRTNLRAIPLKSVTHLRVKGSRGSSEQSWSSS
jgi:hypothetical protein